MLVRAALALDRGDPTGAAAETERFLRRVGTSDRFERVSALELVVRARLELGDRTAAVDAVEELERIAATVGTAPLRAAALLARGRLDGSVGALEDAADLYDACGAKHEAAHARLELARALRAEKRDREAGLAEERAGAVLVDLGAPVPAAQPERALLTRREREVLRLVATAASNDAIAAELVLSVRTVERHVENIYDKIGVSGRTARAAATAWALANGRA